MTKERIKELVQNPDFIPDIYNYCDRWCDRCPFTQRCLNFALSEEQFAEPGSRDISNKLFWQHLLETFRLTQEFLEDAVETSVDAPHHADVESERAWEQRTWDSAEQHICSQAAKAYCALVDTWFKAAENPLASTRTPLQGHSNSHIASSLEALDDDARFEEAREIIRWYQHQIYVKIMRAVTGQLAERSMLSNEHMPKDSDGSAKVALIGIDRSITAWMTLREYLPDAQDEILDLLLYLDRLRRKIERHFPRARAFIRPGFDEITPYP
ncbi:hypothetical protein GF339_19370 [candidate division KSB3 bacterium]|uniref:Uncharacterized protein n=1 Tax=candidate division KSB3 bacterium TaxID=2044937 RepID=A0A9D5JYW0_9BACT|nr:hypothetical protein [candidate division KSB3 bacterium]MBD3326753.1 hypothetical protein [candidate division KSB3 bacterium]